MTQSGEIAKHLREVHFGGNWTSVNLKDKLSDVQWEQATARFQEFHSIATLVYHMNYYLRAITRVLEGGELEAKDKFSFNCPRITSQADWETLQNQTWNDAERLAALIETLPEKKLTADFKSYGSYYRNLHGVIEHCHYHLGQIALVKSLLAQQ